MAKTINLTKVKFTVDLENNKGEESILEKANTTFATKKQVQELIESYLDAIDRAEDTKY
jgi:hypothetical protein